MTTTDWRNETAADVSWGNWETEESRAATHNMTELERAHPRHTAAGMRLDEREDIGRDDA